MKYTTIKGTNLKSSFLALGTDVFGKEISKDKAFEMFNKYVSLGGNMLDSAHIYADWLPGEKHSSEKVIGAWLKSSNQRNNLIIATKGAHPELQTMHISRLSEKEIECDIDESLQCLGINEIDMFWLHRDDKNIPAGEIIESLNKLVTKGKIRYFGSSNWHTSRIAMANKYAKQKGLQPFNASQIKWSLAVTTDGAVEDNTLVEMDEEQYNWYKDEEFTVIPYSSQAKGFFTKLFKLGGCDANPQGKAGLRYYNDINISIYKKLLQLQEEYGVGITELCLAWLVQQPFTTIPIIGCKNTEQLSQSMASTDVIDIIEFKSLPEFNY